MGTYVLLPVNDLFCRLPVCLLSQGVRQIASLGGGGGGAGREKKLAHPPVSLKKKPGMENCFRGYRNRSPCSKRDCVVLQRFIPNNWSHLHVLNYLYDTRSRQVVTTTVQSVKSSERLRECETVVLFVLASASTVNS